MVWLFRFFLMLVLFFACSNNPIDIDTDLSKESFEDGDAAVIETIENTESDSENANARDVNALIIVIPYCFDGLFHCHIHNRVNLISSSNALL